MGTLLHSPLHDGVIIPHSPAAARPECSPALRLTATSRPHPLPGHASLDPGRPSSLDRSAAGAATGLGRFAASRFSVVLWPSHPSLPPIPPALPAQRIPHGVHSSLPERLCARFPGLLRVLQPVHYIIRVHHQTPHPKPRHPAAHQRRATASTVGALNTTNTTPGGYLRRKSNCVYDLASNKRERVLPQCAYCPLPRNNPDADPDRRFGLGRTTAASTVNQVPTSRPIICAALRRLDLPRGFRILRQLPRPSTSHPFYLVSTHQSGRQQATQSLRPGRSAE